MTDDHGPECELLIEWIQEGVKGGVESDTGDDPGKSNREYDEKGEGVLPIEGVARNREGDTRA